MHLDLSQYIGKYMPLPNGRMTLDELVEYLKSAGYEVTKIVDRPNIKIVTVNNEYHVTLNGYVRRAGRSKERFNEWEAERSQRQEKSLILITSFSVSLKILRTMYRLPHGSNEKCTKRYMGFGSRNKYVQNKASW